MTDDDRRNANHAETMRSVRNALHKAGADVLRTNRQLPGNLEREAQERGWRAEAYVWKPTAKLLAFIHSRPTQALRAISGLIRAVAYYDLSNDEIHVVTMGKLWSGSGAALAQGEISAVKLTRKEIDQFEVNRLTLERQRRARDGE